MIFPFALAKFVTYIHIGMLTIKNDFNVNNLRVNRMKNFASWFSVDGHFQGQMGINMLLSILPDKMYM